jgi:outer membrane protein assembly factor BamE (lipoprotein component of BamABCDE complex)
MRAERVRYATYREMTLFNANFKRNISAQALVGLLIASSVLGGCKSSEILSPSETIQQGYVIDEQALAAVPVGSSREQVLLSLGTPSTINTLDGSEVFYYISQTRKRSVAFQKAKLVDQRVMAVYFATDGTVSNIANYGLKDGKVFDFIKRVTPTGGKDLTFIGQVLSGVGKGGVPTLPGQ